MQPNIAMKFVDMWPESSSENAVNLAKKSITIPEISNFSYYFFGAPCIETVKSYRCRVKFYMFQSYPISIFYTLMWEYLNMLVYRYDNLLQDIYEVNTILVALFHLIHCVPKKETTKLLAITFSNLNRFSKFFHC